MGRDSFSYPNPSGYPEKNRGTHLETNIAVKMRGITKVFGSIVANDKVDLDIRRGEILALLGENGSGKTTLMNMLSGIYFPDDGEIEVDGKPVTIGSPKDAFDLGIGMIHQHFKLVDVLTAAENIILGLPGKQRLDMKAVAEEIKKICSQYGFEVDPNQKIYNMSVSQKQTVEIVKVLYRGADILILDEPTAVLTPQETDRLFRIMRNMKADGKSLIIITHKLHEVLDVSDRVAVLRKGEYIGDVATKDADQQSLTDMMVGHTVSLNINRPEPKNVTQRLVVDGLTVYDELGVKRLDDVSFTINAGEVLGIAAIEGNGQSELLEAITGMRRVERGTVEVCGQNVTGKTAGEIRKVGLSHIPEDRLATGVSRSASVTDNLLMGKQRDKAFSGFAFHQRRSSIERYAEEVYERFDIRGAGIDTAVGSMSGGNMQKVVVAREFSFDSPVLIIAQPTRGVDVGAIEFIHTRIIEKRNAGCAILLCSADLDEVFRLSDRIITMYEGRITGEFRTSDITKEEIGWYMTGHREGKEAAKT